MRINKEDYKKPNINIELPKITNNSISNLSILNKMDQWVLTAEKRDLLKHMKYLYKGLFVEGYHTFLYGPAGAGKTTIALHLCFKMAQQGYKIIYFYLDGNMQTASLASEKIEQLGLSENLKILTDGTATEYKDFLNSCIETKQDLNKFVFVLDTYKYFNSNVNDKGANAREMQSIKKLLTLGASFISLGHTNKDGERQSGTAEIEQDTDGLLRIDSVNNNGKFTSTIKRGGRCRFDVIEQSFEFTGGNIEVVPLDEVINVEAKIQQQEQLEQDKYLINEIKALLRSKGTLPQKELLEEIKNTDSVSAGRDKIKTIMQRYMDKHWNMYRTGDRNHIHSYRVID